MKTVSTLLLTGALLLSQHTIAQETCDRYNSSYDKTYCVSKLFVESDNELNIVYKDLRGRLKESAKKELTATQKNWMSYRDQKCQPKSGTINVDCNYQLNRDRTEFLRDRLRECKTGVCREDMIVKESW